MAAASRGSHAVAVLLRGSSNTCSYCVQTSQIASIQSRTYSQVVSAPLETASLLPPLSSPLASDAKPIETQHKGPSQYRIKAGIVLTRAPILTRELTSFEKAFFLYQKRLNERLVAPFRMQAYYKRHTALDLDYRMKIKERHGMAGKDIGRYNPRGRMKWNDEVLVGSNTSEPANFLEKMIADAEMRVSEDGEVIPIEDRVKLKRPLPRQTEADEKNDVRRLDRALDQTLYLIVKKNWKGKSIWDFPSVEVTTTEALHEAAARALAESAGVNMNTWMVGRNPIAFYINPPVFEKGGSIMKEKGVKTFYMKGRILAGQADITGSKHRLTDFKWLTRKELEKALSQDFYNRISGMMAER